jgi:hypothetical protein
MAYQNYAPRPEVPPAAKAAGILLIVSGAFALLVAMFWFAISSLGAFFTLLAVVYLALAVAKLTSGIGLLSLKRWARQLGFVAAAASILVALFMLTKGAVGVLGLAIDGVVIYMLLRPEVSAAYGGGQPWAKAGTAPQGYAPPPPPPPTA